MTGPRPHPFGLVFGEIAAERFPAIAAALDSIPPLDRFLMTEPAVELLHELRPEAGLGDAVDGFVSFVHAAYCHWVGGQRTRALDDDATRELLRRAGDAPPAAPVEPGPVEYIQVAPRLIWSRVEGTDIHEPLDGWFALPSGPALHVVACLGVHPSRPGLSVLTATGEPTARLVRPDGTTPFAPQMEGGDTAGMFSVATPEELLAIGWSAMARGG